MERADDHVAAIRSALDAVATKPERGKTFKGGPSGVRFVRAGRHFAFYRTTSSELIVLTILHERMDVVRHLR